VTNINDSGPGSLRQALVDAHDGDFINFATALFRQTITLSSSELVIEKDITINGRGPDRLALSRSSLLFAAYRPNICRRSYSQGNVVQTHEHKSDFKEL